MKIIDALYSIEKDLILLTENAKLTEEQLQQLADDWNDYFERFSIKDKKTEFDGIMRARVQVGCISIVPPTWEMSRRSNKINETR